MTYLPKGLIVFSKTTLIFPKGHERKNCFHLKDLYNEEKVEYCSELVVQESVFFDVKCLGLNTDIEVVYGKLV